MQLLPNAKTQFIDQNGLPLAGGTVGFYFPGTLNPKTTYQDAAGTIANTNPITLDSRGQALIWGSGVYRQILKDASGVTIWDQVTEDPNSGLTGNLADAVFVAGTDFTPGTTTQLTLPAGPGTIANTWIFFDAAYQDDSQATINGTTLTFGSPIPVGVGKVTVKIGTTVAAGVPANGSVGNAQLAPNAVGDANLLSGSHVSAISKFFITPEMYGAVGDWNGTTGTDNTSAFSAMNAALLAAGGGYVLMKNRYYVPSGWTLPVGNLVVDGCGSGEIHSLGTTNNGISGNATNNVTLRGLKSSIPLTNLRTGFQINVIFINSSNLIVQDNVIVGGVAGIWFDACNKIVASGNYVDTPKADGIHFGQGSFDGMCIGNTVHNCADDAYACTWDGVSRPYNLTFANNILDGSIAGYAFGIYSGDDIVITGNNCRNVGYGLALVTSDPTAGSTPCTNVLVEGNKIDGGCQAEVIPFMYWDNLPNQPVPSTLSGMIVSGTSVCAKGNLINTIASVPNGFARPGCYLDGGSYLAVTGNSFIGINGIGINTGGHLNTEAIINGNTFENVVDMAIFAGSPIATSLCITNNTQGFGAFTANPYLVKLQNAGAVRVMICNNTSASGRGIFTDASSTNFSAVNNNL